jgi:hypothetical protein
LNWVGVMIYTEVQMKKIDTVIAKLASGNEDILKSPSTKVMAINLLSTFNWDLEKIFDTLPHE